MDIKALAHDRLYSMKTYQKETSWRLKVIRELGIKTHHWDTEKVELQHAWNGPLEVLPGGSIVSQPVGCKLARARKGRTCYDEASLVWEHGLHGSGKGQIFRDQWGAQLVSEQHQ